MQINYIKLENNEKFNISDTCIATTRDESVLEIASEVK